MLSKQLGSAGGEVGQNAISTRTFKGSQGFEDHPFTQPTILDRGHVHGVFTADLIDKGRHLEFSLTR